ncbi:Kinase, NAK [Spironucleus salmonicida]|uniref:Kinase, NAK n=1 Tax=Spironucleus salmonicida TaxID=348837 RepID=V6LG59_9EUKA|nr:Kinase, NAK [Spironucleus salmonicida]|eukprot:EST43273.1 Kinase, NAK [Spironucleus salmonicida]
MFKNCLEACQGDNTCYKKLCFGNLQIKLTDILGSGSYGNIYNTNNPQYVVKQVQTQFQETFDQTVQEVKILLEFKGVESILPCYGVLFDEDFVINPVDIPHQADNIFMLLLKCCSQKLTQLSIAEAAGAISNLHLKGYTHRDIKLENLVFHNNKCILIDYGSVSSKTIDSLKLITDRAYNAKINDEIQGQTTPQYRAPELINLYSKLPITQKIDVFALGIIAYQVSRGKAPFPDGEILANFNCRVDYRTDSFLERIIARCLVKDVAARADIFEICRLCESEFGRKFGVQPGETVIKTKDFTSVQKLALPVVMSSIDTILSDFENPNAFEEMLVWVHAQKPALLIEQLLQIDQQFMYARVSLALLAALRQREPIPLALFGDFLQNLRQKCESSSELVPLFYLASYARQIAILHNIAVEGQPRSAIFEQVKFSTAAVLRVMEIRVDNLKDSRGRVASCGVRYYISCLQVCKSQEGSQELFSQIQSAFPAYKAFAGVKFDLLEEFV